ncbi:MAG: beta-galactosidase [Thermoleophilia bacterium]|nr:beta-galactosidase [Thermoleophilia bacterium]
MTHLRTLRMFLPIAFTAALSIIPAYAEGSTLIGMESNRELVNTTQTPALQARALDLMQEQGVQVVRANYRWYDAADGCAGQTAAALENPDNACYQWSQLDGIVKPANDRGMQVLISVQQNPKWLHPGTDTMFMGSTPQQFARTVEFWVSFHKALATRYAQGSPHGFIKYWTVHNEPATQRYWQPRPDAARYAELYGKTAVVIKAANPAALIAPGPTGPRGDRPLGMMPLAFMRQFQVHVVKYLPGSMANKKRYINAWAHNPYPGFNNQPSKLSGTAPPPDVVTMATIDRIFKQLDKAPITRGTKVWATEFGWETNGPFSTSLNRQQVFIPEAFDWLDSKKRIQIGISYGLTDSPAADVNDWTSGTIMNNGIKKPSFKMFQRMISVPAAGLTNSVTRGTTVKVWGRSNVKPAAAKLAFKAPGDIWRFVPAQVMDSNKGIRASYRVSRAGTYQFAVYDGAYGPTRTFRVR